MYILLAGILVLIGLGTLVLQVSARTRVVAMPNHANPPVLIADRYRPMLRLLAEDDLRFGAANGNLHGLRSQRRRLFRSYLRCLTRDYSLLLSGIRTVMVRSGIDRPDLARALAKNRTLFAIALCKIELRLALHAVGVGTVDISALVDAFEGLRAQARILSVAPVAAAAAA